MILPQRGSRAMSTIGVKVQCRPTLRASAAAIEALSSTMAGSQLAACPSGIGNSVLYPWMTSKPSKTGIFRRDCNAARCNSLVNLAPRTFSVEPSKPLRASSICSGLAFPWESPGSCCSCPSFSASVIRAIRTVIFCSIAAFFCAKLPSGSMKNENRTMAGKKVFRNKKLCLLFTVLIFSSYIFGQQNSIADKLGEAAYYLQNNQPDAAEKILRDITRASPANVDAHNLLGIVLDQKGISAEAEREYRLALK